MRFAFFKKTAATGIAVAADHLPAETWFDLAALDLPFAVTPADIATLDDAQRDAIRRALDTTRAQRASSASASITQTTPTKAKWRSPLIPSSFCAASRASSDTRYR
jgi:hypothetical protein